MQYYLLTYRGYSIVCNRLTRHSAMASETFSHITTRLECKQNLPIVVVFLFVKSSKRETIFLVGHMNSPTHNLPTRDHDSNRANMIFLQGLCEYLLVGKIKLLWIYLTKIFISF
ncbi:hypothetical protein Droror1_Dr00004949 [Drosera rotundifolia]